MASTTRSPKYPIMGLADAINRLAALYEHIKTATVDNDVAAKAWGYSSSGKRACGPALQVISTMTQFGLIKRAGAGKIKISELGLDILLPQTPKDKSNAIQTAAGLPTIFRELTNQYPDDLPADDAIKAYLIRRSSPYTEEATKKIIKAFKKTRELLKPPEIESVEDTDEEPRAAESKQFPPPKAKEGGVIWPIPLKEGRMATLTVHDRPPNQEDINWIIKYLQFYIDNLLVKNEEEPKE